MRKEIEEKLFSEGEQVINDWEEDIEDMTTELIISLGLEGAEEKPAALEFLKGMANGIEKLSNKLRR